MRDVMEVAFAITNLLINDLHILYLRFLILCINICPRIVHLPIRLCMIYLKLLLIAVKFWELWYTTKDNKSNMAKLV
jgi:hypothetical protein